MDWFKKVKNKLGIIALFALMFQVTMPIYQSYVHAQEDEIEESVERDADRLEENETETDAEEETQDEKQEEKENQEEAKDEVQDKVQEKPKDKTEGESESNSEKEPDEEETKPDKETELKTDSETKTDDEKNTDESDSVTPDSEQDTSESQSEALREAEEITENIIDDMKLMYKDGTKFEDDDLINVDEDLRFELDWSLSNDKDYVAGDYFEFKLPEQLTVYNPLDGDLGNYGTYTVDTNGNVKFTFNEKVEAESEINGTFWFDTELKESEITSTKETIELEINGEVVEKIKVNVKPTGGQAISKDGQPVDGNFNTEEVEWTVVVNTTRESLKNPIIDDPIKDGQELIMDSIKLTEVEVDLAGDVTKELDEVTDFLNKSTKENLNIELGDTNKAYKLTFKTKLLEEDFEEGTTNYKNDATLKSDGKEDATEGGSVSVSRPKSMEKTSSAFDKEDRSIEWTVNANFTEQHLKKDEVITDEFTFTVGEGEDKEELENVFEIRKENIDIQQVNEFDDKGKPVDESTSDAKDQFDITIEGNKVTYK